MLLSVVKWLLRLMKNVLYVVLSRTVLKRVEYSTTWCYIGQFITHYNILQQSEPIHHAKNHLMVLYRTCGSK